MIDKKEFEESFIKSHVDVIRQIKTISEHEGLKVISSDTAMDKIDAILTRFEKYMDDLHEEGMAE